MRRASLGFCALGLLLPAALGAQDIPGTRLLEVRLDPVMPELGDVFDLHVTFRARGSTMLILPDTLLPTNAVESVGAGTRTDSPGPGDSTDIQATYPVIGLLDGIVDLPGLELSLRPVGAPASTVETGVVYLGTAEIGPFLALTEEGAAAVPRPPADVLGGTWSIWRVLALVVGLVALLAAAGYLVPRWWRDGGAAWVARLRGRSPRQDALRELERIRSLAWHRNGRVADFYVSSTGTLRQFAQRLDPAWTPALTSSELMQELKGRWGTAGVEKLASAVSVAERVKFGAHRPDPDAAEADWAAIRDWVRSLPEEQ